MNGRPVGRAGGVSKQSDLILVVAVVGILLILFAPIPSALLDFLLICNFSFALLILLLTFYVEKPLQFSTFPSLLLIATLFRLALNISATRLILSDADAGRVIAAVGEYVVSGNYVIGLIVFLVLVIVQYVVVTNGAQRVAEVAARFTLDAMPGKQMAIDADMNAGLIDEAEAKRRRREIEKEGNFYGAMDGASKFVKGDAIAGIIIILIDIVAGLAIGVAQNGMDWAQALHTYTLLTVGDGIVTQIPALIISTGTGIIVTRAASDEFLSREISRQITAYPKTLGLIVMGLLAMLVLPGIPTLPVLLVLLPMLGLTWYAMRGVNNTPAAESGTEEPESKEDVYDMLNVHPVEIHIGKSLASLAAGEQSGLMDRIVAFRKQFALEVGFVIPKVRVKEQKKLGDTHYEMVLNGAKTGEGELHPQRWLAIHADDSVVALPGIAAKDPTYGLPGVWIEENLRAQAKQSGYTLVEPLTVLMTHLGEVFRRHAPDLLSRSETEHLLQRVKQHAAGLVDELIPNVLSYSDVQKILQNLLRERVSIRNLEQILEVLVDSGKQIKDPESLTELVRRKLAAVICQKLSTAGGDMHVLTLDPVLEQSLAAGLRHGADNLAHLILEPGFAEKIVTGLGAQVQKMLQENLRPVLLCAPELRRHLRRFTERAMPELAVLSLLEVPATVQLKSYSLVSV